ncbi:MAG: DUF58 domain-containing protein [Armatimonadetes bacterium]|nr:DUF58 domain-containing protein [Armatimonadota bacterium]
MSRVSPTKRVWILLAAGLLFPVGGAFVPGLERIVWPYDMTVLALFALTGLLAARWPAVSVRRVYDSVLSVRTPNRVTLEVESGAPVTLDVELRDEAPLNCEAEGNETRLRLTPRRPESTAYTVIPRERGSDEFRSTFVRFKAPLGLAWVQQQIDNPMPVRVYPNVRKVRDFDLLKQKGRLSQVGVRKSRIRGLGTEFESLRDYNDDDFRFVDWKSTARRGRLVVKNFEQERNQSVIVCLDLGRHMLGEIEGVSKIDHALDAALMLFHAAERSGDLVGLFAFNDAVRAYVAPKRGKAQVAAVLKAAHDVVAEPVQPHYAKAFTYLSSKWKRRSLVVIFTDAENDDQADELADALGPMRRQHLVIVVRVKDPRLSTLLSQPVDTERSLFSRAAATWYQSDRDQAAVRLAGAGLSNIEAEPQDLSAALVSAYFDIKERAAL